MIRPRGISSRRGFLAATSLLAILFIAPGIARHADKAAPRATAPIDILDWKTIGPAAISADGKWLAYRYSPVQGDTSIAHASKVQTPLVIMHNDKDGAVDFTQGIEYYNTLRRLKKPVVMLQYVGENHNLVKPANRYDYTVRMRNTSTII